MSINASRAKQVTKDNDLAEVARGRANIYQLIASFFLTEPKRKMVENILRTEARENLTVLFGKRATKPLNDMAASFKKEDMVEVVQEFHDLFLVQSYDKYTTPYESVYLTGLMLQKPHLEVKRMFEAAGAKFKAGKWMEAEDSLGAELGFMQYLCTQEAKSWAAGKSKAAAEFVRLQDEFLEEHLLNWVDDVCDQIAAKAELGLYITLANVTKSFVNSDFDYVSDSSEALKEQKAGSIKIK